jgi:hypothetical protein
MHELHTAENEHLGKRRTELKWHIGHPAINIMSSEEVEAIEEELAIVRASIESLQETERALSCRLQTLLDGGAHEDPAVNYVLDDELELPQDQSRRLKKQVASLIDFTSAFQPSSSDQENRPWSWTQALHDTMKKIWAIERFRLNQEAVCNAVLSNRDVLVIMPTGGGELLFLTALNKKTCIFY